MYHYRIYSTTCMAEFSGVMMLCALMIRPHLRLRLPW